MSQQPQFSENDQRELAQFLEAENAKARIQQTVHTLTDSCWVKDHIDISQIQRVLIKNMDTFILFRTSVSPRSTTSWNVVKKLVCLTVSNVFWILVCLLSSVSKTCVVLVCKTTNIGLHTVLQYRNITMNPLPSLLHIFFYVPPFSYYIVST
ncbi:unnamed protein product [Absidia cylindrospora]